MLTFDFTIACRPSEVLPRGTVEQIATQCGLCVLTTLVATSSNIKFAASAEPRAVRIFAEQIVTVRGVLSVRVDPVTIN
ncbi:hypothetical protein AWB76_04952 [Caballeronia temeraria]|uniref:Uncharacterized protein n=1 Tax=Caballeronia temeraria TaxID=1777137 RepID=A0A158C0F3_9BURK|nr:hypothetical protein AWB76_04952 [Caballeronia temeraria]